MFTIHRMPLLRPLLRKTRAHLRLLRRDPAKFAANLLQYTNPAAFEEKLLDVHAPQPLHARIDRAEADRPALNLLQPSVAPTAMTGGPNTAVNLAYWLARQGVPVRIVTTAASGTDADWFWRHLAAVTGDSMRPALLSVATAGDPARPLPIGPRDMFLATHWTTAQQVKTLLPCMQVPWFFYLIQDFEPGMHAWSSNYALALETYGLDHVGIFNERLVQEYFVAHGIGRYADPAFAARALAFEPAIDAAVFHPPAARGTAGPRRLLFYARPSNPRNMLGLGVRALRRAVTEPAFQRAPWEFLAIGSRGSLPPLSVGPGHTLRPAPWADLRSYADALRQADILLCPMLSPHTSYPVLEMAACGGIAVTNWFDNKTTERLAALSPNIIAVPPTEDGFVAGLVRAAERVQTGYDPKAGVDLPASWDSALGGVVERMAALFRGAARS
jgi:hypothetical protein